MTTSRPPTPPALAAVLLVAGLALGGAARPGAAQDAERPLLKAELAGRLLPTTGAPEGEIRALAFSANGQTLFMGGSDKYLMSWDMSRDGPALRPRRGTSYYWEIAGGGRGDIRAISVSPDDKLVAFGGFAARMEQGNVVVHDVGTGDLVRVIRQDGQVADLARLAFSPDGKSLLIVDTLGVVRVATVETGAVATLPIPGTPTDMQVGLFLDNATVIVRHAAFDGNRVAAMSIDGRRAPTPFGDVHGGGLIATSNLGPGDRWASAAGDGTVFIWTKSRVERVIPRPGRNLVRAMAVGVDGRLYVGTDIVRRRADGDDPLAASVALDGPGPADRPAVLEVWDPTTGTLLDEKATGYRGHVGLAVSPGGDVLAAESEEEDGVVLYELLGPDRTPFERPLTGGQTILLRGRGGSVWGVAFDAGPTYRIGISKTRRPVATRELGRQGESVDHVFDLGAAVPVAERMDWSEFRSPSENDQGWQWTVSPDRLHVGLWKDRVSRGVIDLPVRLQGVFSAGCWLHDEDGTIDAIAVGTDQGRVFAYSLTDKDARGRPRLIRFCGAQNGPVTGLSVSFDGKYLVSGALDGVVLVMPLEGLRERPAAFPRADAWGATFEIQGDRVVITSARDNGIPATRFMAVGDVVTSVAFDGGGRVVEYRDAPNILKTLAEHPLEYDLRIDTQRGMAPPQPTLLSPIGWRSLGALFMTEDDEWAFWTPQGYYEASARGDALFGYVQILRWDEPDNFFRADQFRAEFERPEVMGQLLATGSVQAALTASGLTVPEDLNLGVMRILDTKPRLSILAPIHNDIVGSEVKVVARAEYPTVEATRQYKVRAYLHGVPATRATEVREGTTVTTTFLIDCPAEENKIVVRLGRDTANGFQSQVEAFRRVRSIGAVELAKPTIHPVGIALSNYVDRANDATKCVEDMDRLFGTLKAKAGEFYTWSEPLTLTDEAVTPASVAAFAEALRNKAKSWPPNDILLVYIGGHGEKTGGVGRNPDGSGGTPLTYYLLPTSMRAKGGAAPFLLKEKAIPWETIEGLVAVPCRRIVLLDSCHSGAAVSADNESAIRSLDGREVLVLAAAAAGTLAQLDLQDRSYFTTTAIEALEGNADGISDPISDPYKRDRTVDLYEFMNYIKRTVRERVQKERKILQSPEFSSADLGPIRLVPVVGPEAP